MNINTSIFTTLFQDGRLVVDGGLVIVVYYTALNILRLRDDVRELRIQLFGTAQRKGAVQQIEQDVEKLNEAVFERRRED